MNNLKVFYGTESDTINSDTINNVQRLELDADGIKYNLIPLANGWVEITVNGQLVVKVNQNALKGQTTINLNID